MQTGIVDGAENNMPSYANGQHYRYAKYYSLTEHLIMPEILVFSKRIWDTLSKDDQALVMKFAKEAQQEQRKLWDGDGGEVARADEEGGHRDHRPSGQEDRSRMRSSRSGTSTAPNMPMLVKRIQDVK